VRVLRVLFIHRSGNHEAAMVRQDMKAINLNNGYVTLVDDEDYERVHHLPWRVYKDKRRATAYARYYKYSPETRKSRSIYLHSLLMDTPKGYCVDHKNGNGLDNTRSNLRVVSIGANLHNARRPMAKSGFRGVEFCKHVSKYRAFINCNHKYKHIGYFTCPIEAAKARDREALRLYGKDATLNFPEGNE
jgi:hypothetical protein